MAASLLRLKRIRWSIAVLTCVILLILLHRSGFEHATDPGGLSGVHGPVLVNALSVPDSEIMPELRLDYPIEFHRHCIVAHERPGLKRQTLVNISQNFPFARSNKLLEPADIADGLPPCTTESHVDFAELHSPARDTSGLLLGVATKLSRIEPSLEEMRHWLSGMRSRLVVLIVDVSDLEAIEDAISRVYAKAASLRIDIALYSHPTPEDSEGLKNFGLAGPLWEEVQLRKESRWVAIIDDDTFFVSLPRMVETLAAYDHSTSLYLGQLSEGWTRVNREGFKAWGGAGFFISIPLLSQIAKHSEDCRSMGAEYGDLLWRDCIYNITSPTVQLTRLEGLNQMDFWKDPAGWYEAGHDPILTVHHWKSWHFHNVPAAHIVTEIAGPDTFLQRYAFADDRFVLTNGFSLVYYPGGVPDMSLTELTMTEDPGIERAPDWKEFHLSMGRTRPALKPGVEKVSWGFRNAWRSSSGEVRQFYVRPRSGDSDMTGLVEVDWRAANT